MKANIAVLIKAAQVPLRKAVIGKDWVAYLDSFFATYTLGRARQSVLD